MFFPVSFVIVIRNKSLIFPANSLVEALLFIEPFPTNWTETYIFHINIKCYGTDSFQQQNSSETQKENLESTKPYYLNWSVATKATHLCDMRTATAKYFSKVILHFIFILYVLNDAAFCQKCNQSTSFIDVTYDQVILLLGTNRTHHQYICRWGKSLIKI